MSLPFDRFSDENSSKNQTPLIVLPIFAVTLFVSALLLFAIQPYFSKLVLPKLGGSPGVWSVAMIFFQSVLLLGYAYAHLLTRYVGIQYAVAIHALVLTSAFLFLPLGITNGWETPPESGQEFWLIGLFGASIGVPFFAVAANAPLLQAWFSKSGHPHAKDPYFLYGASNIGSFFSLYIYILLIEPNFTLKNQAILWAGGYTILLFGILLCSSYLLPRLNPTSMAFRSLPEQANCSQPLENLTVVQKALIVGIAAIPSGLTVAVTAFISIDLASAPFLWVIPLSLFLLTFVLSFRQSPPISLKFLSNVFPWVLIIATFVIFFTPTPNIVGSLILTLLCFFLAALFCHTLLYSRRPDVRQLTSFYFWMSLGGVIGGVFAGLIAPRVFDWVAEFPLLMLAVIFLLPYKRKTSGKSLFAGLVIGIGLAALLSFALQSEISSTLLKRSHVLVLLIGMVTFAAFVQLRSQSAALSLLIAAIPLAITSLHLGNNIYSERSFFGVIKVNSASDGQYRLMLHGTTVHGVTHKSAFASEVGEGTPEALSYYHHSGEMAEVLQAVRKKLGGQINRGAIVGLGTGSFLCHSKSKERWTVFEIDKTVIDIASNPSYFRFITDCAPDARQILGDARLTLAHEPDQHFDFLLIDAFSSDSIPVHLMTLEALNLYFSKLAPNGLLAMHISNRHLELESILAAIAEQEGLAIRSAQFERDKTERARKIFPAKTVVLARTDEQLGPLSSDPRWDKVTSGGTLPWTDDYSDVIGAILRHQLRNPDPS